MASFAAKILKNSALVYDLRWQDEHGVGFFVILQVEKAKHAALKEKLESGASIHFPDYGTVLHSGIGEPDESLKAELREKFGMFDSGDA